ncbi:MAG: hypothetical protein IJK60_06445 [Clostridia bacterium]|nr:hypothetical protein [Clostridia bacterium]
MNLTPTALVRLSHQKDNGPLVWWITDDGIGTNVDNAKRDMKYKADGDKLVGKLLGIEFVLEKVTDAEETEEAEKTASGSARLMVINSEPFVITAKEGFDNFGVTALICDATETYSFTASDENTTWSVFVLDEEFADDARYLPQAETPALEGDGTLEIEAGKYIYILCSENSFSGETASDATLSIDYAPVAE